MNEVAVVVPARADAVQVLRSVVASVASMSDVSYDGIEDLRIAVDEACAFLLGSAKPATELSMRVRSLDSMIEIVTSSDAPLDGWPPSDGHYPITWQVLSAVADEVRMEVPGGRPTITFIKRTIERS